MRLEVPLASLPPGARVLVRAGELEIALFNVDGRVYAVNNACPHRGGPLVRGAIETTPEGPMLRCPMHGWPFRLATGESVRPGRATVYTVEVLGETAVILVGDGPGAAAPGPHAGRADVASEGGQ